MGHEKINSQSSFLSRDTFSRTDLTTADKVSRLKHKIESRCSYFREQVELRQNHPEEAFFRENLEEFESKANHHLKILSGVGNNFNYNKTVDKGKNEGVDSYRNKVRTAATISRAAERRINKFERDEYDYRQAYTWSRNWGTKREHIQSEIGIKMPDEYLHESEEGIKYLIEMLKDCSYLGAVETMKARLIMEMIEAYKNEWHMIFNTITVKPEHYKEVFEKGSDIWRNYIRKIKRQLATSLYGSVRNAGGKDYFHYMAVVEEGASNGRLHIHCMLFMKDLVKRDEEGRKVAGMVKDPNYGKNPPTYREIEEMCWHWEYGHSQFIPIRFSNSDPWGKMGWVWPVMSDGQPLPSSSIEKIASYMTKYILKSKDNKGEAKWRTKTDRQLGLRQLQSTLRKMEMKPLVSLVKYTKHPVPIQLYGNKVPVKLIRQKAVKELVARMKNKRIPLRSSQANTILKTLMQQGIQTRLEHNSTNIGDSLLRLFNGRDTSKANLKYFLEARNILQEAFAIEEYVTLAGGGNTDNR